MLLPTYHFRSITQIPQEFLLGHGLRHVILDVDNTLTLHGHPIPAAGVPEWIQKCRDSGISLMILSNNNAQRVRPFAERLGLDFVSGGKKPLKDGYEQCRRRFGCEKGSLCVIGDQLLTDIWGGNRYGIATILVDPIAEEKMWLFRIKRRLEERVLHHYQRRGRGGYER